MKATVSIEIDTDSLQSVTDAYLASLWHVAQANPADGFESPYPGELAEHIGREIVRRFVRKTGPELWNHRGSNFDWGQRHLKSEDRAGQRWEKIADEFRARRLLDGVEDDVMHNMRSAVIKILKEDDSRFVEGFK
ncbi:hypothetical protein [Bradyrhizobium cenepequi]